MFRPSQISPDSAQLARLVLAKFSHTHTSIDHNGPLNWNHLMGNGDLIGIFEKGSTNGPGVMKMMLKVFQNEELLEEIDLARHIRETANQTALKQKSHFAVIVRAPCLAVKYSMADKFMKRFQIKFSSDRDFYTALAILSDIKCPFSESNMNSSQPSRKPTSSWNLPASAPRDIYSSSGLPNPVMNNPSFPLLSTTSTSSGTASGHSSSSSFARTMATDVTTPITTNQGLFAQPPYQLDSSHPPSDNLSTLSRPSTATAYHDLEALNRDLPPTRELPFAKPAAKRARTAAGKQNSEADTQTEASAPASTSTSKSKKPAQKRQRKAPATKASQNPNRPSTSTAEPTSKQTPPFLELGQHPHPHPSPAALQMPMPTPAQILPSQPPRSHPDILSSNLSLNPNSTPFSTTPHPLQKHPAADTVADVLETYPTTPPSDRMPILENWICAQLENDAFLGLCRDVEGVWRRVAFGVP